MYPTNQPTAVLRGGLANNTPANPGINIMLDDANPGSVTIVDDSNGGNCVLSGDVAALSFAQVAPGGGVANNLWDVVLTMGSNALDSCQGDTISYDYTLNVETP
jgi:hypothetical protein